MRTNISKFLILLMLFGITFSLGAQGVQDQVQQPEKQVIRIAALQGPTGFGLARILGEGAQGDLISFETQVLPSPNEAVARMASGELDAALLPVNLASVVYNRGLPFRPAAVTGLGMIHLLSRDRSVTTWDDLSGRELHVSARGATPDYLTQFILEEKGIAGDVLLNYSITSAPQLAQMMIAGRVDHIVVPEPFATMADLSGGEQVHRVLDYQSAWQEIQDTDAVYPMTVLVVSDALLDGDPRIIQELFGEIAASIQWTYANPEEASVIIEQKGILTAAMARPAIPNSGLTFEPMEHARESVADFLQVLYQFESSSVGGALPDDRFYWSR